MHVSKLLVLLFVAAPLAFAGESSFSGTWRFDPKRSTELSPWKDCTLEMRADAGGVTIHRAFKWGRRDFTDQMTVKPGETVIVPVEMWPDNRHIGAYLGGDHQKHVTAQWLDEHRILRLSTDIPLATQQGPRSVNILSDFQLSVDGAVLTVIEIRSTRNRPIVSTFHRVTPGAQP